MMPNIQIGAHTLVFYNIFNAVAFCACLICNLCFVLRECTLLQERSSLLSGRLKGKDPEVVALFVLLFLSIAQYGAGVAASMTFGNLFTNGHINYFGNIYSLLLLAAVLALVKIDPLRQLDLIIPAHAVSLVFFKMACFMAGCCNGKECAGGFYFVRNQRYEFPSQLLEMLVALVIAIVLICTLRKGLFPGRLHALYLILYSATRFFTEFTREGDVIFAGLQAYQLQCLVTLALSVCAWFLLGKYGNSISEHFVQSSGSDIQANVNPDL